MRLFHVSEEAGIKNFEPRLPTRKDLDQTTGLVWAITDKCLPNFLTPRNCARVAYYMGRETSDEDCEKFFSQKGSSHVVAIEYKDLPMLMNTTLYIYEFDPVSFELMDEIAGYYVSKESVTPIGVHIVNDIIHEHRCRNVELRVMNRLWSFAERVRESSLNWSLCRMNFATKDS